MSFKVEDRKSAHKPCKHRVQRHVGNDRSWYCTQKKDACQKQTVSECSVNIAPIEAAPLTTDDLWELFLKLRAIMDACNVPYDSRRVGLPAEVIPKLLKDERFISIGIHYDVKRLVGRFAGIDVFLVSPETRVIDEAPGMAECCDRNSRSGSE